MNDHNSEPLSLGGWIGTILIGLIPCVGIVMYIVWAVSANTNIHRKTYSQAMLILMVAGIVIGIVVGLLFGAALAVLLDGF
ncbi:MAG: hypothetical protein FWG65_06400 [Turicibacter sp.]|nr:hypothetical protein [Turicibacter sp.]